VVTRGSDCSCQDCSLCGERDCKPEDHHCQECELQGTDYCGCRDCSYCGVRVCDPEDHHCRGCRLMGTNDCGCQPIRLFRAPSQYDVLNINNGRDLTATNPSAQRTVKFHVSEGSKYRTQYISLSDNIMCALWHACCSFKLKKSNRIEILEIHCNLHASNQERMLHDEMARNFAKASCEFVVEGHIPYECIKVVHDFTYDCADLRRYVVTKISDFRAYIEGNKRVKSRVESMGYSLSF
jgi:hypothetical protein